MAPSPSELASEQPSSITDALSPPPEPFRPGGNSLDWSLAVGGDNDDTPGTPRLTPYAQPEGRHAKERRPLPSIPGYELIEELGRGGMGVVYKARHLGLNRLVALKMILAAEMASQDALTRFRAEAQLLAQLQHPNIVQVYDVGTFEDKSGTARPYMALELVEGGNLSRQLRGQPQSPWEAATLIAILARAMHAAHEKGIIHRDLKPGNVLLSGDAPARRGGELVSSSVKPWSSISTPTPRQFVTPLPHQSPQPKITDFGLAKRLEGDPNRTRTGEIVGTPNYMAPEQAEGRSPQLGPAVDIYALGAILYELLTGRPPFQGVSPMDTVLQVLSRDPLPPSFLQHELPRDIETICLKCLRREPQQRYATAADLADDLQRFLNGDAILARPVGRLERAGRWCRRNPAVAGLMGAVVLLLLGGIAVSSHFAYREAERAEQARLAEAAARREQQRAAANEARARENEQRAMEEEAAARLVSDFLTGLFQDSDPLAIGGRVFGALPRRSDTLLARDVVDRGRQQLETKLKDEPKLRALLLDKIGNVYLGLGDVDQAEKMLLEALRLRQEVLPTDHPDLASSLQSVGFVRFLRHRPDAVAFFRKALAIRERRYGPGDARTAETQVYLAMPLVRDQEFAEGEALLHRALAVRRRLPGDQRREIAVPLVILCFSLLERGALAEAWPPVMELIRLCEEIELKGVGSVLQKGVAAKVAEQLNPRKAVDLWRESLKEAAALLGPEHFILTFLRSELVELLVKLEDGPGLEQELRVAIPLLRRFYDTRSHMVGNALKNLGFGLVLQKRPAEALPPLDEAIAILRTFEDTDGLWRLSQAYDQRGHAMFDLGNLPEAALAWQEELALRIRLHRHHSHKADVIRTVASKLEDAAFFQEKLGQRWPLLEEISSWFDPGGELLPVRAVHALLLVADHLEVMGLAGTALRQAAHEQLRQWQRVHPGSETLRQALPRMYAQAAVCQARLGDFAGAVELLDEFRRTVEAHRPSYGPDFKALYPVQLVEHACLLAVGSQVLAEHDAAFPPRLLACRQQWTGRAMQLLRGAVRAGYRNVERLRTDPELASLRGLPEFQQLLREVESATP